MKTYKVKANKKEMKNYILSIFQNTDIDKFFILFATELGYAEYFTNLKPLDNMNKSELTICFERVNHITNAIVKYAEFISKKK